MIQLKNLGNAKTYALQASRAAKRPSETEQAKQLLSHVAYLESPQAKANAEATLAAVPVATTDEVRAELESKLSGEFTTTIRKNRDFFVTGKFVDLACAGKEATVTVDSGARKLKLVIADPDQVVIKGAGLATVELTCGPQPGNVVITVAYSPPPDGLSVDGVIGSIEFQ